MELLLIIYYIGITSCCIQGVEKSCGKHESFCFLLAFFSSLGGGMFRDLFGLFVFPLALTRDCIPEILIALCTVFLYRTLSWKHAMLQSKIKQFTMITDSLGLGTFIAFGIDRALKLGANQITAFCCGIVTALGGGILSSLLCGKSLREVLTANIPYRVITIIGAILYMYFLTNGINPITAQYCLILYTLFFIPMSDCNLEATLLRFFRYPTEMLTPIPMGAAFYQLNTCSLCIPGQPPISYFFSRSDVAWDMKLSCIEHTAKLLNFKSLCPRRFSRGR